MDLKKTVTHPRVNYVGVGSLELPAGSQVLMRKKLPNSGWENFLEEDVPEGKNWQMTTSISIEELDV